MESDLCNERPDRHLQCLAELPISFLSEQGDRLARICAPPVGCDNYRDLFASSVWVYSLHAYIALLGKQLSDDVGKAVWLRQRNMFDAINNDFSQSMESAFMLIDSALELDNNSPETSVALALLLGMPESPDYASCMKERTDRIQTMQAGVESHLARCLLYAREELLAACSRLFPYKQTGLLQVDDEPCNGEDS